jgi:peroxiredoxin
MNKLTIAILSAPALLAACRFGESGGAEHASAFDAGAQRSDVATTVPASSPGPGPSTGESDEAASRAPSPYSPRKILIDKAQLGEAAPDFALTDINGHTHRLSQYKEKHVVLEWLNPRSPYCIEMHNEGGTLRELPSHWTSEGVVWLAINSQSPGEPGSAVEETRAFAREHGIRYPLLLDPTGAVGRAYGAKTTPYVCVISQKGLLVYRGALDNAPDGIVPPKEVKTNFVDAALRDLRWGRAVTIVESRSYGTPIQYAKP